METWMPWKGRARDFKGFPYHSLWHVTYAAHYRPDTDGCTNWVKEVPWAKALIRCVCVDTVLLLYYYYYYYCVYVMVQVWSVIKPTVRDSDQISPRQSPGFEAVLYYRAVLLIRTAQQKWTIYSHGGSELQFAGGKLWLLWLTAAFHDHFIALCQLEHLSVNVEFARSIYTVETIFGIEKRSALQGF